MNQSRQRGAVAELGQPVSWSRRGREKARRLAGILLILFGLACVQRLSGQTVPATTWTLKGGSTSSVNVNGSYSGSGSAGVPGSRQGAVNWTDQNGNLWLFGGLGYDQSSGAAVRLNDLWEYTGGSWTQRSAAATATVSAGACNAGVFGTQNVVASSNWPGGRKDGSGWVDGNGNLWLFGGDGCGSTTTAGALNDLWEYSITSGQWTWQGGSQGTNVASTYGTAGTPSAVYMPGGRSGAAAWSSSDGTLWLLGGQGYDVNGLYGYERDLWQYSPSNRTWTWVTGGKVRNQPGSYGAQGVASTANQPGSRSLASAVSDASGNLWLYGGNGYDGSGNQDLLGDLWKYSPTAGAWSWISGTNVVDGWSSYGTEYSAGGEPGARDGARLWADASGNLWLFAGSGVDGNGAAGYLNDLWEYDQTAAQWTWMGGASDVATAQSATPAGRAAAAGWIDGSGNFWFLGGYGVENASSGELNDFWEAVPPTPTPSFNLAAGTYEGSQQVTVSEALSGAAIYYTTDGTAPSTASTEIAPGSTVSIASSATLNAIAVAGSHAASLVRSASYVIENTPTISWTTPSAITYPAALTTQLSATASFSGATVSGTMSYTDVATGAAISSGTVLTAGSHVLEATFTPTDTTDYKTATATVTLVVNQATPTVSWTAPNAISYGSTLSATQLDATASVAGTYEYSPAAGTTLSVGTQTLTVTFYPNDSTDYATVKQSVQITVNQATPAINWQAPAAITYGTALSGTQLDAVATTAGSYSYSPAAGTLLTAGTHTLTVSFTPTDTTNYKSATSSVTLTVAAATPVINWATPAAITYGTALSGTQLNAAAVYQGASVDGSYSYSPSAGTVLTAGTQNLSVTFTPADAVDYNTVTKQVTITVSPEVPAVTWATPSAITYGTALSSTQLNASSAVAGTYVYSPAAGSILQAGVQTLTVTFYPTDTTRYASAQQTVLLSVNQATPVINWQTPAPIYYGTALSSTQLDASSTVSGTFTYSPAAGSILTTGTQTLTVSFVPTDTTDYKTTTATVQITVNTANFAITLTPSSQTIPNGGMAVYVVTASSTVGVFSSPITLSVAGLPTGATATFSPTTLTPGSSTASGTLTIVTDQKTTTGSNKHNGFPLGGPLTMTPLMALLAGFGMRRMRKGRKLLPVLLLVLSLGAALGLTACADVKKSTTAYTLTVTGTADGISNAAVAELLIEK